MKLIKKIAAIMFAFIMGFTLSSNVNAETVSGSQAEKTTGTLTITNAKPNQTYNLYKMLDLESFSGENYSYKIAEGWNDFFTNSAYEGYKLFNSENGYVTPKHALQDSDLRTLANKALEFANGKITPITVQTNDQGTFTANNLILGYYLLDSSVGTICSLTSSNPNVEIKEKNDIPTVTKLVKGDNDTWDKTNFANIGDTVNFKTTITAQPGAEKYILHDIMDAAFTFKKNSIVVKSGETTIDQTNYDIYYDKNDTTATNKAEDDCTFEIRFKQDYLNTLVKDQQIVVTYNAILNEKATINRGDHNKAKLTYGDKGSVEDTTTTSTSQMKVLKYTETTTNTLDGAKFKLYTQQTGKEALKFTKKDDQNYILTKEATGQDEIETIKEGTFTLQGLKPGVTYWLEETEAPKGYNKLTSRIKVEIKDYGMVIVNDKDTGHPLSQVEVENKSGSLLPSTGGMGTTLIYLIGGALVLGSGIVLANKKRAKAK